MPLTCLRCRSGCPRSWSTSKRADLLIRAGVCVLVLAPAGLLMGFGFPTGMRLVSAISTTPTPWFWGINGGCRCPRRLALPLATSVAVSIDATLRVGAACYLLVAAPAVCWRPFGRDLAPPLRSLHPSEDANKLWKCQFCWRRSEAVVGSHQYTQCSHVHETTTSVIAFWSQSVWVKKIVASGGRTS